MPKKTERMVSLSVEKMSNLRYADDTIILGKDEPEMYELPQRIEETSLESRLLRKRSNCSFKIVDRTR